MTDTMCSQRCCELSLKLLLCMMYVCLKSLELMFLISQNCKLGFTEEACVKATILMNVYVF